MSSRLGEAVRFAELPEHRGLAHLPRPGEQHDRKLSAGAADGGFKGAREVHGGGSKKRLICI
jgi:hypothetical protein